MWGTFSEESATIAGVADGRALCYAEGSAAASYTTIRNAAASEKLVQ